MRWIVVSCMAVACTSNGVEPSNEPVCDGRLQPGEEFVDSPWDRDGDGYFDFSNLFCSETYGVNRFDCDDSDPDIHVDAVEIVCNGVDDDCSFLTPDGEDLDGDGATDCIDCDDGNPLRSPLFDEVCWDDVDNDCDGDVDPGCGPNYNGIYDLAFPIYYACADGEVDLDIVQMQVIWEPPTIRVVPLDMFPEIEMEGTVDEYGGFRAQVQLDKDCNQKYGIDATFTSEDTFFGEFRTSWGQLTCSGCPNPYSVTVSGTKVVNDSKKTVK